MMLSLANVKSSMAAASYYESADDYYQKDNCQSSWSGLAAQALGLEGEVDHLAFAGLLEGRLPNGERLHNAAAGRRGATDATFSAPKSVSLQALIGGDRRVIEAHRIAVDRALEFVERFAGCRATKAGETIFEPTRKLLAARFEHDLSRSCDPQLHTHCVLINATVREDGQWRALDNEFLYRRKMLLGAFYRAELARELQGLGFGIRVTHLDGSFELSHISDEQVRAFSTRSAAIEAYLSDQGLGRGQASAELKKLIALATRDRKTAVDRRQLRKSWGELSATHAISYKPAPELGVEFDPSVSGAVLRDTLTHLGERQAVFDHITLTASALGLGIGRLTLHDIEQAITAAVVGGELIRVGDRYTTLSMLQLETDILDLERAGRHSLSPIYHGDRSELTTQLAGLSEGQRQAALGILITSSRAIGIQGRAGVGKTTLLRKATEIAELAGYQVKGLAPSASAARELAAAGIQSETISAFARRFDKQLAPKTLLIVDEAGMASTRQMHCIMQAVADANCRVVLVGDTAQLQAVEAGKPFAQLQAAGMHTALVSEIQRQKSAELKHAVELSVVGQVGLAVELLQKHVTQITDAADRFERIANDYVQLGVTGREQALVVAGTRYARSQINLRIREKLGFSGAGQVLSLLDRKDLSESQRRSTLAYEPGDIVLAEVNYKSLGLRRGQTAMVVERRPAAIILQTPDGRRFPWKPAIATNLTAFSPVAQELAVGEQVRVTANNRELGVVNGDVARISAFDVESQTLSIALSDGRVVVLDAQQPLTLAYGYCSTIHSAQGQTCERVLIEADANSLTSNQQSFYVAISRARQAVNIYTDDRDMLPLAMSRELLKESAMELVADRRHIDMEHGNE